MAKRRSKAGNSVAESQNYKLTDADLMSVNDRDAKHFAGRVRQKLKKRATVNELKRLCVSEEQINAVAAGGVETKLLLKHLRSAWAIESNYQTRAKLTMGMPTRHFNKERGRRALYAMQCRGLSANLVANVLRVELAELTEILRGGREMTLGEGLSLSLLLNVEPSWLAVGGPPVLTETRVDEITRDDPPATFRELIALSAALKASPFEIAWGNPTSKSKPRKRRTSAA